MNCFIKCFFVALPLTTFSFRAKSQAKTINISEDDRSWYSIDTGVAKKVHLNDLTNVNEGAHWRFWYTKFIASAFVIDIWRKDNLHCKAFVTLYTYGDFEGNTSKYKKVYFKQVELNRKEAGQLFKLTENLNISNYTNREQVDNGRATKIWEKTDSAPYMAEYANDKSYIFRACARRVDAVKIKTALDAIDTILNFQRLNDAFEKNIPFENYSSDRWQGKRKTLTDKQKQTYAKYWKRHPQE